MERRAAMISGRRASWEATARRGRIPPPTHFTTYEFERLTIFLSTATEKKYKVTDM